MMKRIFIGLMLLVCVGSLWAGGKKEESFYDNIKDNKKIWFSNTDTLTGREIDRMSYTIKTKYTEGMTSVYVNLGETWDYVIIKDTIDVEGEDYELYVYRDSNFNIIPKSFGDKFFGALTAETLTTKYFENSSHSEVTMENISDGTINLSDFTLNELEVIEKPAKLDETDTNESQVKLEWSNYKDIRKFEIVFLNIEQSFLQSQIKKLQVELIPEFFEGERKLFSMLPNHDYVFKALAVIMYLFNIKDDYRQNEIEALDDLFNKVINSSMDIAGEIERENYNYFTGDTGLKGTYNEVYNYSKIWEEDTFKNNVVTYNESHEDKILMLRDYKYNLIKSFRAHFAHKFEDHPYYKDDGELSLPYMDLSKKTFEQIYGVKRNLYISAYFALSYHKYQYKPILSHVIKSRLEKKGKSYNYTDFKPITQNEGEKLARSALRYLTWGVEYTPFQSANTISLGKTTNIVNNSANKERLDMWLELQDGASSLNNYLIKEHVNVYNPNDLDITKMEDNLIHVPKQVQTISPDFCGSRFEILGRLTGDSDYELSRVDFWTSRNIGWDFGVIRNIDTYGSNDQVGVIQDSDLVKIFDRKIQIDDYNPNGITEHNNLHFDRKSSSDDIDVKLYFSGATDVGGLLIVRGFHKMEARNFSANTNEEEKEFFQLIVERGSARTTLHASQFLEYVVDKDNTGVFKVFGAPESSNPAGYGLYTSEFSYGKDENGENVPNKHVTYSYLIPKPETVPLLKDCDGLFYIDKTRNPIVNISEMMVFQENPILFDISDDNINNSSSNDSFFSFLNKSEILETNMQESDGENNSGILQLFSNGDFTKGYKVESMLSIGKLYVALNKTSRIKQIVLWEKEANPDLNSSIFTEPCQVLSGGFIGDKDGFALATNQNINFNSLFNKSVIDTPFISSNGNPVPGNPLPYAPFGIDSPRTFLYKMREQVFARKKYFDMVDSVYKKTQFYYRDSTLGQDKSGFLDFMGGYVNELEIFNVKDNALNLSVSRSTFNYNEEDYYNHVSDHLPVGKETPWSENRILKPFLPGFYANTGYSYIGAANSLYNPDKIAGVDSLGMLMGSIAMTDIPNIRNALNQKPAGLLNQYFSMLPADEVDGIDFSGLDNEGKPAFYTQKSELGLDNNSYLNIPMRFSRSDLEKNTLIIPDVSFISKGDLLVCYDIRGEPHIGIVVGFTWSTQPEYGTPARDVWDKILVVSVRRGFQHVSVGTWGSPYNMFGGFTTDPEKYHIRRLLKSDDTLSKSTQDVYPFEPFEFLGIVDGDSSIENLPEETTEENLILYFRNTLANIASEHLASVKNSISETVRTLQEDLTAFPIDPPTPTPFFLEDAKPEPTEGVTPTPSPTPSPTPDPYRDPTPSPPVYYKLRATTDLSGVPYLSTSGRPHFNQLRAAINADKNYAAILIDLKYHKNYLTFFSTEGLGALTPEHYEMYTTGLIYSSDVFQAQEECDKQIAMYTTKRLSLRKSNPGLNLVKLNEIDATTTDQELLNHINENKPLVLDKIQSIEPSITHTLDQLFLLDSLVLEAKKRLNISDHLIIPDDHPQAGELIALQAAANKEINRLQSIQNWKTIGNITLTVTAVTLSIATAGSAAPIAILVQSLAVAEFIVGFSFSLEDITESEYIRDAVIAQYDNMSPVLTSKTLEKAEGEVAMNYFFAILDVVGFAGDLVEIAKLVDMISELSQASIKTLGKLPRKMRKALVSLNPKKLNSVLENMSKLDNIADLGKKFKNVGKIDEAVAMFSNLSSGGMENLKKFDIFADLEDFMKIRGSGDETAQLLNRLTDPRMLIDATFIAESTTKYGDELTKINTVLNLVTGASDSRKKTMLIEWVAGQTPEMILTLLKNDTLEGIGDIKASIDNLFALKKSILSNDTIRKMAGDINILKRNRVRETDLTSYMDMSKYTGEQLSNSRAVIKELFDNLGPTENRILLRLTDMNEVVRRSSLVHARNGIKELTELSDTDLDTALEELGILKEHYLLLLKASEEGLEVPLEVGGDSKIKRFLAYVIRDTNKAHEYITKPDIFPKPDLIKGNTGKVSFGIPENRAGLATLPPWTTEGEWGAGVQDVLFHLTEKFLPQRVLDDLKVKQMKPVTYLKQLQKNHDYETLYWDYAEFLFDKGYYIDDTDYFIIKQFDLDNPDIFIADGFFSDYEPSSFLEIKNGKWTILSDNELTQTDTGINDAINTLFKKDINTTGLSADDIDDLFRKHEIFLHAAQENNHLRFLTGQAPPVIVLKEGKAYNLQSKLDMHAFFNYHFDFDLYRWYDKVEADLMIRKSLDQLNNTDNFTGHAWKHIMIGELNHRNKAVGFHYENFPGNRGRIIRGTEMPTLSNGVYQAKITVDGIVKTSNGGLNSFFPKDWSPQKGIDEINYAYSNMYSELDTKNIFGTTSNGIVHGHDNSPSFPLLG